jgi:hypothetical protein
MKEGSTVTPKPADNYTKVFIVVGAFLVTTLVAVIVFATLRVLTDQRRKTTLL